MNIIEKAKKTVKENKKAIIGASVTMGVIATAGIGYLCGVQATNNRWSEICNLAAFGDEVVKLTYRPTGDKYDMVLTKVVEEVVVEI